MAERLTECIDSHLLDNGEIVKEYGLNNNIKFNQFSAMDIPNAVYDKLGKLEDIFGKYGIESVEELEKRLQNLFELTCGRKNGKTIARKIILFDKMKQDRDTWQKACELACRHIAEVEWLSCPETDDISESEDEIKTLTNQSLNFFYQQAKKEKK